ncbi:MAG: hypothetical protein CHACPFDD_00015 [Phycisphaerae bacterium]|nr:hypothetical protein [Phycisphaerae bacterium]
MASHRRFSDIALDIGPASIAWCQFRRTAAGRVPHCCGAVFDGLRQRPEADLTSGRLLGRVARVAEQSRFRGRSVAIALKPPDVAFIPMTVPAALLEGPAAQRLTAMRFEAAREMQTDANSLLLDTLPLPPGNRNGQNTMIVAAPRDVVARWSGLLESVDLDLATVDTAPLAMLRAAAVGKTIEPNALWGVVDIGFSSSVVALAIGHAMVYVRLMAEAGDAATSAIAQTLNVDYGPAEIVKTRFAAADRLPEPAGDSVAPHEDPRAAAMIRTHFELIASEVSRAFAYALESYDNVVATALYLTGGGSEAREACEVFAHTLGIPVSRIEPPRSSADRALSDAELRRAAVAYGLALGDRA